MQPATRKSILTAHRWTGLTIGLVIAFMAATGITLVFRKELEPVVARDLMRVAPCADRLPLDDLAGRARQAHPDGRLDYVRIFGAPDAALLFRIGDGDSVYLNPCTGAVLGVQNRYGGLFGTLELVHRLKFGAGSNLLTGTSAIALVLVLAAGGVAMWWPASRRGLKPALTFNPRLKGRSWLLNLHRTVGVYAATVLALSAMTGLPQAFDWYKDLVYQIVGSPMPRRDFVSQDNGAGRLPMEQIWRVARELEPNAGEALLHYPAQPRDPIEIYMIGADAPHPNARTYAYLDAYSGQVLSFVPYDRSSLGHRLYFWTLSWHTGQLGTFNQIVLAFGGLSALVLAYTGVSSYFRRATRAKSAAVEPA